MVQTVFIAQKLGSAFLCCVPKFQRGKRKREIINLTDIEPGVAEAGRMTLKYMVITIDINPVANSSSNGPISRIVQSKHIPTPI